jgi:uncharacterized protein YecT (DUF1311 family)
MTRICGVILARPVGRGAIIVALLATFAGTGAAAQDCARRFPDRLICENPELHAADAAMGQAYEALRARSDDPTRERLRTAQRRWLALRARACAGFYDHEDLDRARCLADMTRGRSAALAAGRITGEIVAEQAGTPALVVETEALGDPQRRCAVNIRYPRLDTAGPEAAAFNRAVRRTVEDPLFVQYGGGFAAYRGCPPRTHAFPYYDYNLDFSVTMRTARVIAVRFTLYYDSGNSHPLGVERGVIVDLAQRRALAIGDLITPEGLPVVEAACRRSLEADYDGASGLSIDRFARIVRTTAAWSIAPGEISIGFPPSAILPGPPLATDCTVAIDTVRPYLAAGSPLR